MTPEVTAQVAATLAAILLAVFTFCVSLYEAGREKYGKTAQGAMLSSAVLSLIAAEAAGTTALLALLDATGIYQQNAYETGLLVSQVVVLAIGPIVALATIAK